MKTHVVVDLGYGDSGKGSTVDALVRKVGATTVVRFNGGAQAGHNVVVPGGDHHTFSQWGSGHFAGARTILSRFMIIHPLAAFAEAEHLVALGFHSPFMHLTVDGMCLVTTPYHQAMNRIREMLRGHQRHGSCGVGIGETVRCADHPDKANALRAYDLPNTVTLTAKLERLRLRLLAELAQMDFDQEDARFATEMNIFLPDHIPAIVRRFQRYAQLVDIRDIHSVPLDGDVVFEGAQGVLLDEWHGFDPYTTWSTCTSENARTLIHEWKLPEPEVTGVLRAYAVRHGPGPMVSEDPGLTQRIQDAHNKHHAWQGPVRLGWFDMVASHYAIDADGHIDQLAITCLDRLASVTDWRACLAYQHADWPPGEGTRLSVMGRDLSYQKQLTLELMQATPVNVLTTCSNAFQARVEEHLGFISDGLGVRIGVVSTGWTYQDKRWCAEV